MSMEVQRYKANVVLSREILNHIEKQPMELDQAQEKLSRLNLSQLTYQSFEQVKEYVKILKTQADTEEDYRRAKRDIKQATRHAFIKLSSQAPGSQEFCRNLKNKKYEVLEAFLNKGIFGPDAPLLVHPRLSGHYVTPLGYSCVEGDIKLVDFFLGKGSDPNWGADWRTGPFADGDIDCLSPLLGTLSSCKLDIGHRIQILSRLLKAGADPLQLNDHNTSFCLPAHITFASLSGGVHILHTLFNAVQDISRAILQRQSGAKYSFLDAMLDDEWAAHHNLWNFVNQCALVVIFHGLPLPADFTGQPTDFTAEQTERRKALVPPLHVLERSLSLEDGVAMREAEKKDLEASLENRRTITRTLLQPFLHADLLPIVLGYAAATDFDIRVKVASRCFNRVFRTDPPIYFF